MAIFKKGAKGSPIKKLQEQLNKNGAKPKLAINGVFDDKMLDCVKTFQKKAKLKVDGIVGPNTQAAMESGGKSPKWTVKDVKGPIKKVEEKKEDAWKSWIELAALAGSRPDDKDLKFAYRNFKIIVNTYVDYLKMFVEELTKIEDLRVRFEKDLKTKPHEQALALDEATDSFKKAQKMNKIAEKLKRKFDYEHDNFLAALDNVPA